MILPQRLFSAFFSVTISGILNSMIWIKPTFVWEFWFEVRIAWNRRNFYGFFSISSVRNFFFFGFDNSTILHFDRNTKYLWKRFDFQKRSQSNRANVSMSANWTLQQEETQINIIVFLLRITKGQLVGSSTSWHAAVAAAASTMIRTLLPNQRKILFAHQLL